MSDALDLPPGFTLLRLAALDRPPAEARRLREAGAAAYTFVWAERQSGGRGRRGRSWISPVGNGYCSLLLRPDVAPGVAAQVSFVAALAVAETIASLLPVGRKVACKWPNDVLVDGLKISGILLESRMGRQPGGRVDWLVVGVGINIASFPPGTDYPATALHDAGGAAPVEQVLEAYAVRMAHWLKIWRDDGFAPVRQAWLRWADGLGGKVVVRLADRTIEGIFSALDDSGALILSLADGRERTVTAGDVFPAA